MWCSLSFSRNRAIEDSPALCTQFGEGSVCVSVCLFFCFVFFLLVPFLRACGENLQSKKLTKTAALLLKENTPTVVIICA